MVMWIYLLLVNGFAYLLFAEDKKRARRGQWRIPESTLLLAALCGGSVGALLAMQICRHKTRKWKFRAGIPVILIFQAILLAYANFLTGYVY